MLYHCCCHQSVVIVICMLYLVCVLIYFINVFLEDNNDMLRNGVAGNSESLSLDRNSNYRQLSSAGDKQRPPSPKKPIEIEKDFYYYFNHVFKK